MEILKKNKFIIIGITFLFIGFVVYNNFFKKEEPKGVQDVVITEMDKDTLDMLNVLDKIKDIEINPDFFNQKPDDKGYILVFSELDPSEPRPNRKIPGKINPFILGGATIYQDFSSDEGQQVGADEGEVQETILSSDDN